MVYSKAEINEKSEKMIRKVEIDEIPRLYPFVLRIFKDMGLPILDKINPVTLEQIIVDAMHSPYYRYGYENAYIYLVGDEITGVLFGYPGEWEALIDGPLQASMLKFGFSYKKFLQENETLPGEWYIDTLVIDPDFRRQGIAGKLLSYVEDVAKENDFDRIALNCEMDNGPAHKLYLKSGFVNGTHIVLSGHIYWHMTKEL